MICAKHSLPPNKRCDLVPNGISSIIVEAGVSNRPRVLRLPASVDVTDEDELTCLRNIDRVWTPCRWKVLCECDKSKSFGVLSGVIISWYSLTEEPVSVGRSLGRILALSIADCQCEGFCFVTDCSLSKSTRRERGDIVGSLLWIAGKTGNLFRIGEDDPGEWRCSKIKWLFLWSFYSI
jgi:hypothetical protein